VEGPAADDESRALDARLCLVEVLDWMEEVDDLREWAMGAG